MRWPRVGARGLVEGARGLIAGAPGLVDGARGLIGGARGLGELERSGERDSGEEWACESESAGDSGRGQTGLEARSAWIQTSFLDFGL